jgi:hypothetical protein
MAATRSAPSANGPTLGAAVKAKEAGDAVASAARRAPAGAVAAGAAAAGLAGGLVLGARVTPRGGLLKPVKVLGMPIGRRRGAARALARGTRRVASAASKASSTADDIRAIRQQLEHANRRSPIEIVLDGLTHRRGAHKLET